MPPRRAVDPDLSPSLASLNRRLSDLRTFQLPRLRECRGPVSVQRDLADEMRGDLEMVRAGLEEARERAEALGDEHVRGRVKGECDEIEAEHDALRREYRIALIESKRAMAAASSRHELLRTDADDTSGASTSGSSDVSKSKLKAGATTGLVGGDDELQTKTNDVTDALRRTTQLMQAELERSVLSVQMLDESTRTLRSTHTLYDTYTSLLTASSQLVRHLERADWWDRALIFAALSLFLLVVAFVVKRRVLDKVGRGVGWWVGGSFKLVRMGLGGGSASGGGGGVKGEEVGVVLGKEKVGSVVSEVMSVVTGAAAAAAAAGVGSAVKQALGGDKHPKADQVEGEVDLLGQEDQEYVVDELVPPQEAPSSAITVDEPRPPQGKDEL